MNAGHGRHRCPHRHRVTPGIAGLEANVAGAIGGVVGSVAPALVFVVRRRVAVAVDGRPVMMLRMIVF
jgi:hypothetical protein